MARSIEQIPPKLKTLATRIYSKYYLARFPIGEVFNFAGKRASAGAVFLQLILRRFCHAGFDKLSRHLKLNVGAGRLTATAKLSKNRP
jgi:hypothetical protein